MRKTWIFFKLRMRQLMYDKAGLFFAYVFPVLLLFGIGFPVEKSSNHQIGVMYLESEMSSAERRLIADISKSDLVDFEAFYGDRVEAENQLIDNEIQHLIRVASGSTPDAIQFELKTNSLRENQIAAMALNGVLRGHRYGAVTVADVQLRKVDVSKSSSYLAVLLPGVIAITLLVIGLNGIGTVLMDEEVLGLYKNLKTIDVSPVPFFSGLMLSRMLISYTVAIAMFAISVLALGVSTEINYVLLILVVTLGAGTFIAMGLLIYLISKTAMAFNGIVSVVQIPLVLLGGAFFSIALFPDWFEPIAKLSPMAPFTSALRDLMFGGVGFHNISQLYPSMMTMSVWLVVFLLLSKWKFRW